MEPKDQSDPTAESLAEFAKTEHVMQFFSYAHLPGGLQEVSKPFAVLAVQVVTLPRNPERTKALDLLLAAKDAAVRAFIAK